jgi:DNA polymerase III gamma/tau subunit
MARDDGALDRRREVLQAARSVPEKSVADRLALAEKILDEFRANREAVYSQLAEWAGWWRDVMLVQLAAEGGVANLDMMDGLRQDASRYSRTEVLAFIHAILAAREQLRSSVQPRPALELLVLETPAASSQTRP